MISRDEMKSRLREGVCDVTFTKVNGETRVMKCTLNENIIPPKETAAIDSTDSKRRSHNENTIAVWDIDKEGWRSFRVESVVDFEVESTL